MNAIRPSECWACRVMFQDDVTGAGQEFRLRVFGRLREDGPEAARDLVDEQYAEDHADHERSWV